MSRWGSDIGGYDTIGADPQLTPELRKRWIAFGAVSGVMRIKKSGLEIPPYPRRDRAGAARRAAAVRRAGAAIPMLPADVFTLSDYGAGEVVRLADRRGQMRLLAFPAERGSWRVEIDGDMRRRYALEAAYRACAVALDGRPLAGSAWRQRAGVLTASFSVRRGTLSVRGCD